MADEKLDIQSAEGYSEEIHSCGDWWKQIPQDDCIIVYLDDGDERNKGCLRPVKILSEKQFKELVQEKKKLGETRETRRYERRSDESNKEYEERMASEVIDDLISQFHSKGHVVVMKVLKSYITD